MRKLQKGNLLPAYERHAVDFLVTLVIRGNLQKPFLSCAASWKIRGIKLIFEKRHMRKLGFRRLLPLANFSCPCYISHPRIRKKPVDYYGHVTVDMKLLTESFRGGMLLARLTVEVFDSRRLSG